MCSALINIPDFCDEDLEYSRGITREEHGLYAIRVGCTTHVGPLAVESLIHGCRQVRDIIGTRESFLLSNEEPFHVNAPGSTGDAPEDLAIGRTTEDLFAREPQEKSLGRGHLRCGKVAKDDLGPDSLRIARGTDHGMEGRYLRETVLGSFDDRNVSVSRQDLNTDSATVEGGECVLQP